MYSRLQEAGEELGEMVVILKGLKFLFGMMKRFLEKVVIIAKPCLYAQCH